MLDSQKYRLMMKTCVMFGMVLYCVKRVVSGQFSGGDCLALSMSTDGVPIFLSGIWIGPHLSRILNASNLVCQISRVKLVDSALL